MHEPGRAGRFGAKGVPVPPYRRGMVLQTSSERPIDHATRRLSGGAGSDESDESAREGQAADEPAPSPLRSADGWDGPADTALARWLPDGAAGGAGRWLAGIRADPGRAGVAALGVVGLLAVGVTVVSLMRDGSPPVAAAKLPPVHPASAAAPAPGPAPAGGAPTAEPDGPVVVSVVGLVGRPGLVTVAPGGRIADALDAAGGPLKGADLVGLNMARKVADGEQIVVGVSGPPGARPGMGSSISPVSGAAVSPGGVASPAGGAMSPGGGAPPGETGAVAAPVDLNAATAAQLDELPGVGPVTAAAIVAWRDANGRFTTVDQLGEVDGIGPARLERLRPRVHV